MTGPWKARKSKSSFPSLSPAPWESRKHREIPTFPPPGFAPDGKVENQKQVSHFPTGGSRRPTHVPYLRNQNPRKEVGRCAASSSFIFQDHSVLEPDSDFRIILGLENAPLTASRRRARDTVGPLTATPGAGAEQE